MAQSLAGSASVVSALKRGFTGSAQQGGIVLLQSLTDMVQCLQRLPQAVGDRIEVLEKIAELLLGHFFRSLLANLTLRGRSFDDFAQVRNVERLGDIIEGVEA